MSADASRHGEGRRLLVLEPYHGGSHRAVLECLLPRLGWEHDLLTLPARHWKWRMRGSAVMFADEALRLAEGRRRRWDVILASTFLDLAQFKGLAGDAVAGARTIVYFHENQLVYPNRHVAEWDLHFPLTNVTSALAADECWFNTHWNLERFLEELPGFIALFPQPRPKGLVERIAAKSRVVPPPFDPHPFDAAPIARGERCRVVWPHRWEHDKDPEAFFAAASALAAEGLDFEVAVAGQAFADTSEEFRRAGESLGGRLVHLGQPESREHYARLLAGSDVAVSTAVNEFFGLAMVEAAYAGCDLLVPDRLAYPELWPVRMRYGDHDQLVARLRAAVTDRPAPGAARSLAERFTIDRLLPAWQDGLEAVARR